MFLHYLFSSLGDVSNTVVQCRMLTNASKTVLLSKNVDLSWYKVLSRYTGLTFNMEYFLLF